MKPGTGQRKNVRKAMAAQDRDVSRIIGWLAGISAAFVALSLPSVYFTIAYKSMDAALRAEARASSHEVNRIVGELPDLWEFESARIAYFLEEQVEGRKDESRHVFNNDRHAVAQTVGRPAPPVVARARPIHDSGHVVGRVEVRRSLRPILWMTGMLALCGGLLGAGVFYGFKALPMAALRKAIGQLALEKERAHVTLGSISDGVITTDAGGMVELMNGPAESVTGWSREEAAGRPIREVFRVLEGGPRHVLVRRDGVQRLIDDSEAPISDGRGGRAGTVFVIRDMTERVQKEEELQKLRKLESIGNLPASAERPPMGAAAPGNAPSKRVARVLVMDDEDLVREMALGILEHLGYESEEAKDGAEAIRKYADAAKGGKPFDLVIMDLMVPGGMGGKDASRQILRMFPDARLVVSSGYSSDPVMADHLAYGFRAVLPKPYRVEDFTKVLKRILAA